MLYYFETAKELRKLKVDCIRTDLDVALTFAQIACQTDDREKTIRTQHNARKGYDAGLQFMSTAKITRFDLEVIEEKLIGLKSALLGLGESF
jgi:hypothetical protein